jgi:L-glyceraldehyde 3-phosphate reductase
MLVRQPEENLLDILEKEGIGCIAFSPLAQGLLTDKYLHGIPDESRIAKPHGFLQKQAITPELLEKVGSLNSLAARRGQSLAQMALAWLMKDTRVTSVLLGVSSVKQLVHNLSAMQNLEFSQAELDRIEKILNQS